MNGLSAMKRTASTSMSIFAVRSAITFLSAKPVMCPPRRGIASSHHLPFDGFAAAIEQRTLVGTRDFDLDRRGPWRLFQHDFILVRRQTIMLGPVERGKGLEPVERLLLLEHLGVGRKR